MMSIKAPLGEVCPAKPLKQKSISAEEVVWQLNLDQIESDTGIVIDKQYAPVNDAGNSTHWFDQHHVLYSKLRPYLNKVVLPDEIGIATTELVPLLPDSQRLDRKYLSYYLRSKSFVNWVNNQVAGAKMPRVSMKVFWEHEIPLPSLKEQKRIAAILDKADAIRRKRQQAIQLADQFLHAVFLDMFGEYFHTAGYEEAFRKSISELTTYIDYRGKTPEKSDYGIPLITAKNVKNGYISDEPREYIPEENYESWMTRGEPLNNDVLFTTEAPLGNVALLGKYEKVAVGQRIVALRTRGEITHEYLLFSLLHPFIQSKIYSLSSGSTARGIRTKEFYSIEIPVPNLNEQKRFSEIYWKHKKILSMHFSVKTDGKRLFESLSQKAFAGEL